MSDVRCEGRCGPASVCSSVGISELPGSQAHIQRFPQLIFFSSKMSTKASISSVYNLPCCLAPVDRQRRPPAGGAPV